MYERLAEIVLPKRLARLRAPLFGFVVLTAVLLPTARSSAATQSVSSNGPTLTAAGQIDSVSPSSLKNAAMAELKEPSWFPALPMLPSRPPSGKTLYYVSDGDPGQQLVEDGVQAAAQALKWHFKTISYNPAVPSSANSEVLAAIGQGAVGVVLATVPPESLVTAVAAAKAKGSHVVLIGNYGPSIAGLELADTGAPVIGPQESDLASFIAYHSVQSNSAAHVLEVTTSGVAPFPPEEAAFKSDLTKDCKDCTVASLNVGLSSYVSGQTSSSVVSYIQVHPDINYVDLLLGAAEGNMRAALNSAGLNSVNIVGAIPNPAQNQEIKTGASLAWLQEPDEEEGWLAVDTVARAVTGGNPSIDATTRLQLWMVDKENLHFNTSVLPDYPPGYQHFFEHLWRES
jgi:ABC-type sugar transport system substrate-binding protein